jgi:hypothetical protein
MTANPMIDITYNLSKDTIVQQINFYDSRVCDLEQEIEEKQKQLSAAKVRLATFQYCLSKLEEDFQK